MAEDSQKSEQSQDPNNAPKASHDSPKAKDANQPVEATAKPQDKPQDKPQENKSAGEQKGSSPRKFKLGLPKFSFPKFKFSFNLFNLGKSQAQDAKPKQKNLLWLWLSIILISYAFIGYFLSVLLTMRSQRILAIAGFVVMGLLPLITAFADYGLMKWGYLISGFLIVGGLIFLIKIKFYFLVLAIMTWLGITMIAFVGEHLIIQKHKFAIAILILTIPCLMGLVLGWQVWRFVAMNMS